MNTIQARRHFLSGAAAAGVKLLVLSHLVPSDDDSLTDDMWTEGVLKHYSGKVIVGRDLLEI